MTKESARLQQKDWKKWRPYLSERQWGTVREDYSATGEAWDYFSHEQARSRAYRWGEDGINDYIVNEEDYAINPERVGTKCSPYYQLKLDSGANKTIKLRLCDR
jgi:hypothetical protein